MTSVAVCVCTCDRRAQLGRLLDVLSKLPRPQGTIFVIVESGGRNSQTEALVRRFRESSRSLVEFVVEQKPGISAARNAALAAARGAGASAVAMLDDDEWPSPEWLTELLNTQFASGAAVVGGPVRPVFARRVAKLRRYENLWSVEKGALNGRLHVYCTCNCLLVWSAIGTPGTASFPDEFGLTGGEDVVFFRRLHFAGVPMAWSEAAVVFEDVPEERASFAWMRRRWYRHGNVGVRCELAAPGPEELSPLLKTGLLCARLLVYPLFNRRALRAPMLWLLEGEKIRGRIASHIGRVSQNYGRIAGQSDTVSPKTTDTSG